MSGFNIVGQDAGGNHWLSGALRGIAPEQLERAVSELF